MKLKQSINRFSKGHGGYVCVGSPDNISAVSEFELLFHKVLAITNLVTLILKDEVMRHLETNIQHTLSVRKGIIFDKNMSKFFDIISSKGNPYKITLPLHNVLTMNVIEKVTKERVLGVLTDGKAEYTKFRSSVKVSDLPHKIVV